VHETFCASHSHVAPAPWHKLLASIVCGVVQSIVAWNPVQLISFELAVQSPFAVLQVVSSCARSKSW